MTAHDPMPGCDGRCTDYVITRGIMAITEITSYVKACEEIVPDYIRPEVGDVLKRYLGVALEALTDFQSHTGTPHVSAFMEAAEWWERKATA